jgi:lysine 6-dehydrogenase
MDAGQQRELAGLISAFKPHAMICMLPPQFGLPAASAAVDAGIHYISTSYTGDLVQLDDRAKARDVIVLPEMGMDPGIDLVLGRLAISELDSVHGLYSYGGGIPDADSARDNPLNYKISWTFEGVLKAYRRPARLLENGRIVQIPAGGIFDPRFVHRVSFDGIGDLEACPNGDALKYVDMYDIGNAIKDTARYTLRWPGHSRIWSAMTQLGFLDDCPVQVSGIPVVPVQFVQKLLEPKLQFGKTERDMAVLRVVAWGLKDGSSLKVACDLIDYRDLETGFYAMNRTVGFTASIGAQMILSEKITKSGVLSPARDVPPAIFFQEMAARGMKFQTHFIR